MVGWLVQFYSWFFLWLVASINVWLLCVVASTWLVTSMDGRQTDRQTGRQKETSLVGSVLQLFASTDAYFYGWLHRDRERDRQIDREI